MPPSSSLDIVVRSPRPGEMEAYYRLRWETLRADRGLPPGSERDELDDTDEVRHLAAFVEGPPEMTGDAVDEASCASSSTSCDAFTDAGEMMVGVGRLELLRPVGARMAEHAPPDSVAATAYGNLRVGRARLMGVAPEWRRKGIGRALNEAVIEAARKWGCDRIVADARAEAVYYYVACDFDVVSDDYYIKDIGSHRRVEREV